MTAETTTGTIRLALVDDHAIVRDGLRVVLEAAGHEVVGEAAGPTPALADLARLHPEIALVDLRLGLRSGFELLAEIQRRQHLSARNRYARSDPGRSTLCYLRYFPSALMRK